MTIFREMIKYPFELSYKPSSIELNEYLEKCLKIYKVLDDFNIKDKDAFFKLVKLVFRKRLNISKNLKLEKFYSFSDGYIVYEGEYRQEYKRYNSKTDDYDKEYKWEEVRVEVEIDDYKIVANIVFMENGEIRQSQLRIDK